MKRTVRRSMAVLALLLACKGEPSGPPAPEPGFLVVRLTTPNAGDAAAMLLIIGTGIGEVEAPATSLMLFSHQQTATVRRVAVFGALTTGAVARFAVPNIHARGDYAVMLLEVADGTNALRPNTVGYSLSVTKE